MKVHETLYPFYTVKGIAHESIYSIRNLFEIVVSCRYHVSKKGVLSVVLYRIF